VARTVARGKEKRVIIIIAIINIIQERNTTKARDIGRNIGQIKWNAIASNAR
jgi:hypothetical protein